MNTITEAQVTAYLRQKCAELQRKAGEVYVCLEVNSRRLDTGFECGDWRAYIEGGESFRSETADEAIAGALDKFGPNAKAARLRREITAAQNELAKLEAGK